MKSQPLFLAISLSLIALFPPPLHAQSKCAIESFPHIPDVIIKSATLESNPVKHCKVNGVIGSEAHFELLLPQDYNGKFVMGGGGGFVGIIMNAAEDFIGVIEKGYATVATDTGHQAHPLDASWALNNPDRIVNFGHLAVHRTAVTAKKLIKEYYKREINRSYFFGCSRGGGQALMEAQRYPDDFEGIVAMSPAYDWTHEMGARWIRVAQHMYPDPNNIIKPVIGPVQLALIGNYVMAECDELDGIKDGILNDPSQCTVDLSTLSCGPDKPGNCLTREQLLAAEAIYGDFEIDGQVIHGTPPGAELPTTQLGWMRWYTGGYSPAKTLEFHAGAETQEFIAPPTPNATWAFATGIFKYFLYNDPGWEYTDYGFKDFAEKAARVGKILNADNPDLSEFRELGGKLIIDNGWMDGSLSAYNTIKYYNRVVDHDPSAPEYIRLFLRPGVTHCRMGPGPDGTDYLAAIDEWVESGIAPDQLPAPYGSSNEKSSNEGRIICAYPKVVTYNGHGSPSDPSSFKCTAP